MKALAAIFAALLTACAATHPTAPPQPAVSASMSPDNRALALSAASTWLGELISEDHHPTIRAVTTTDGRFAFSSLVSEMDPAWLVELPAFSLSIGNGACSKPLNLMILIRQRDSALLGIRSRWPHEDMGIDVLDDLEPNCRGLSFPPSFHPTITLPPSHRASLVDILEKLHDAAAKAEYISACLAYPDDLGNVDGPTRTKGPLWLIQLAWLANTPVPPPNTVPDRQSDQHPYRVIAEYRTYIADTTLQGGSFSNRTFLNISIVTAAGATENRNWYDDLHPPPFGLARPQARSTTTSR